MYIHDYTMMDNYSEYAGADGFPMDLPIPSSVLIIARLESVRLGDVIGECIPEIASKIILRSLCENQDNL